MKSNFVLFVSIVSVLMLSAATYAAVNTNLGWHPMQQISTGLGTTSIDNNGDNVIDQADNSNYLGYLPKTSFCRNEGGWQNCPVTTDTRCDASGVCSQVCIGSDCRSSWPGSAGITSINTQAGPAITVAGAGLVGISQGGNTITVTGNAPYLAQVTKTSGGASVDANSDGTIDSAYYADVLDGLDSTDFCRKTGANCPSFSITDPVLHVSGDHWVELYNSTTLTSPYQTGWFWSSSGSGSAARGLLSLYQDNDMIVSYNFDNLVTSFGGRVSISGPASIQGTFTARSTGSIGAGGQSLDISTDGYLSDFDDPVTVNDDIQILGSARLTSPDQTRNGKIFRGDDGWLYIIGDDSFSDVQGIRLQRIGGTDVLRVENNLVNIYGALNVHSSASADNVITISETDGSGSDSKLIIDGSTDGAETPASLESNSGGDLLIKAPTGWIYGYSNKFEWKNAAGLISWAYLDDNGFVGIANVANAASVKGIPATVTDGSYSVGVWGGKTQAAPAGSVIGVYGRIGTSTLPTDGTDYAGYFDGNVKVTGNFVSGRRHFTSPQLAGGDRITTDAYSAERFCNERGFDAYENVQQLLVGPPATIATWEIVTVGTTDIWAWKTRTAPAFIDVITSIDCINP